MATATISGSTIKTISGGSASDRLTLTDIAQASNSGLNAPIPNTAYQPTPGALRHILGTSAFADLTGGVLIYDNAANGQNTSFFLDGDVVVGGQNDFRPFTIKIGEKSLTTSYSQVPFIGVNAVLSMPKPENRLVIEGFTDQPNSVQPSQPGARSVLHFENNIAGNEVRISVLGAPYVDDNSYTLPSQTGFKPNGTFVVQWRIGPNVTVRDFEFKDGYIDWRPGGNWAAPTRGVFVAKSWIKFLGTKSFSNSSPLLFGSADEAFNILVGEDGQSGSYMLHGLYPSGSLGRIVYLNFTGLNWETQMALYSAGKTVRVENHLVFKYKVIDTLAQPVSGAKIIIYKKDPSYPANGQVNFSTTETTVEETTDSTGEGNIGSDTGSGDFICVEAFSRTASGGNVDVDYANPNHSTAQYASNTSLAFAVVKYGKVAAFRQALTAAKAGASGEGKQSLGVIQLNDDLAIVEQDAATALAYSTQETPEKAYDHLSALFERDYDSESGPTCSRVGDSLDFGSLNLIIDGSGSGEASVSNSSVKLNASTFTGNLTTTGTVSVINGATIVGGIIDSNGDSFLSFSGVTSWRVYATEADQGSNSNLISSGNVSDKFRFTYSSGTTYYMRLVVGSETIFKVSTPTASGQTDVTLEIAGLLTALPTELDKVLVNRLDGSDLPGVTAQAIDGLIGDDVRAIATKAETDASFAALNDLSAAQVLTQAAAALNTYDGPTKAELDAGLAALNDLSAAQVNAQVDAALADYDGPTKAELDAGLANLNNLSAAEVNAQVDIALADYDAPTKSELDAGLAGLNDLSAADVNAQVDIALADYDAPTKAELDAGLAGLNDLSATDVNAQVDIALNDYDSATKAEMDAAFAALHNLSAADVNAQVDIALNDYDAPTKAELDAGLGALNNLSADDVNTQLDAALADYDGPTKAELDAGLAALNNLSAADVWAAASRTLTDKTGFELSTSAIAAIATKVEQSILDDSDGQQVLNAIVGAIGNSNVDEVALVAAIRADIERNGGLLAEIPTLTEMEASTSLTQVADVSALATAAQVSALNNITAADVWASPTRSLSDKADFGLSSTSVAAIIAGQRADAERAGGPISLIQSNVDAILARHDGPTVFRDDQDQETTPELAVFVDMYPPGQTSFTPAATGRIKRVTMKDDQDASVVLTKRTREV